MWIILQVCIQAMGHTECISPLKQAMQARKDMIGVACEALNRLFSANHDLLIRQVGCTIFVSFNLNSLNMGDFPFFSISLSLHPAHYIHFAWRQNCVTQEEKRDPGVASHIPQTQKKRCAVMLCVCVCRVFAKQHSPAFLTVMKM